MERTRRRLWTRLVTVAASLVLAAAVVSAMFQLVVLTVPGYREELAQRVSGLLGRPVRVEAVALTWHLYYPVLELSRLELRDAADEKTLLVADRLRLGFSPLGLARGELAPSHVELHGLDLALVQQPDGRWAPAVRLLPEPSADELPLLARLAALQRLHLAGIRLDLDGKGERFDGRYEIREAELGAGLFGHRISADVRLPPGLGRQLELRARLQGDLQDPQSLAGAMQAEVVGLTATQLIQPWLAPGVEWNVVGAQLQLQMEIQQGRPGPARIALHTGPVQARRGTLRAGLERLAAYARLEAQPDGAWVLDLERLALTSAHGRWPETGGRLAYRPAGEQPAVFEGHLTQLRLADAAPWLALLRADPWLTDLHDLGGELEQLQWRWEPELSSRYALRGRFRNLHLPAAGRRLGFSSLNGAVAVDEQGGRVVLEEGPAEIELPAALSAALPLERLDGEAEWRRLPCTGSCRDSGGWELRAPRLSWALHGAAGEAQGSIQLPRQGAPELALRARMSAADAARLKPYMPRDWSPQLRRWLQEAVTTARVPLAELRLDGPLDRFPFEEGGHGRFELDIEVADAALRFAPDWPAIEGMRARVELRGGSLSIAADEGRLRGARLERALALFRRFDDPLLEIDARVGGDLPALYEVVRNSPLRQRLAPLTERTRAEGKALVNLSLDLPLTALEDTQVEGSIQVQDVSLRYEGLDDPIRNIEGQIHFTDDALRAEGLQARFHELPIQARITPGANGSSLLSASFEWSADPEGRGASALVPAWLRPVLQGRTAWRALLHLGGAAEGGLRLESSLQGLAITLPAPLGKAAEERAPLGLSFSAGERLPLRVGIDHGERLQADLQFGRSREELRLRRGVLQLGSGATPQPVADALVIGARLELLEVERWTAALAGLGADGNPPRLGLRAEVQAARVLFGGYELPRLQAQLERGREIWTVRVEGEAAQGTLRWRQGAGSLEGELQHLTVSSSRGGTAEATEGPARDPATLPTIQLEIGRLTANGHALGKAVMRTVRIPQGQRLEQLRLSGGLVELAASGQWLRRDGRSSASLQAELDSKDFAGFMEALGYARTLEAGDAHIRADLHWLPDAGGLRWTQANGPVELQFADGQLHSVEPGAGRVLGLINFYALPRRLSLNFRDVVSKGLGFDEIEGRFDLADGHAHTEHVEIKAPSMRMLVRGRIGLEARDYDQHVTVYPGLSSGVTLGAVLLGGPAAGALALVAQEVLNKPLDQVTQLSYRLTGSWDNPKLEPASGKSS